ncbi:MAG: hypothetical protein U1G08_16455 [Verrucomicrobiota bacterium]
MDSRRSIGKLRILGAMIVALGLFRAGAGAEPVTSASGSADGTLPGGAMDGDRFSVEAGHLWRGDAGASHWWWQVDFGSPRAVGTVLQVLGGHEFVLNSGPAASVWQASADGVTWNPLPETAVSRETHLFRIHRLSTAIRTRFLRWVVDDVVGSAPTLREVEVYPETGSPVPFPDWVLAVNVTEDPSLPGHGQEFLPLARSVRPDLRAQQIWIPDLSPEWIAVEPRPMAAFLSGSFRDWCEVNRDHWKGVERVLRAGRLPMWASCGGAQGLAILAENGTDQPWDCPHCRKADAPRLPIYIHIGHRPGAAILTCGHYDDCVFERGPHRIRPRVADPVFEGLPPEFSVMESHCGQIGWAPNGWDLIAEGGPGTKTRIQCLRLRGHPVYAAQFHIEMDGTPEVSRTLMGNFLRVAKQWTP